MRIFWLCVAFLLFGANIAHAKPAPRPFVSFGAATAMPTGLDELCRSQPAVCATMAGAGNAMLTATATDPEADRARLRLLKRVDATINAHVRQQSDRASYGVGDLWRPSGVGRNAVGDCEDLAIQKRLELLQAGFPPERLFLAIVYRTDLGLHTVLVARLDGGDMVLDSRSSFIASWARTPYQWVIAEQPGSPTQWNAVS
ncbi:putative transglutaminase-like cysteine proteinase [Sphingomonas sp. PvP055]|uniref:transglutaminase-like cysteine peptidase n=1 Tax=Sphingomonas sp. PvP055 TaxID=3156391 RepID=UPI0033916F45